MASQDTCPTCKTSIFWRYARDGRLYAAVHRNTTRPHASVCDQIVRDNAAAAADVRREEAIAALHATWADRINPQQYDLTDEAERADYLAQVAQYSEQLATIN